MKELKKYYIYILRCNDLSLYVGITTDLKKRYNEHLEKRGAKYTKRGIKKLEIFFSCLGRSEASRVEYFLKGLKKEKKERLILNFQELEELIEEKLNIKIKKENIF